MNDETDGSRTICGLVEFKRDSIPAFRAPNPANEEKYMMTEYSKLK